MKQTSRTAKSTAARFEPGTRIAHVTSFFDAWRDGGPVRRVMRQDRISLLTVRELTSLAAEAGLIADTLASDYAMGQFAADSDRLVMVCRPGPD